MPPTRRPPARSHRPHRPHLHRRETPHTPPSPQASAHTPSPARRATHVHHPSPPPFARHPACSAHNSLRETTSPVPPRAKTPTPHPSAAPAATPPFPQQRYAVHVASASGCDIPRREASSVFAPTPPRSASTPHSPWSSALSAPVEACMYSSARLSPS
ncbi:uncharacterized protein H6S33_004929 [Morchella sextelata]|uniref:uncharacterized protein n=1 Tax=Morchella sextelata TaxID=1174677 RepID=UPI001D051FD0|nr:uncharacterized protein H6S33_004929 [Morchella sextelata]KAH0604947.1 hypothetical protein H6S33_004929 [Morchella sextelata]